MTHLVGITGKAGVGKDTFASALYAKGYTRLAFADPVKEVTALIACEEVHLYHDPDTKEGWSPGLGMERRKAMQQVGNGMREALGNLVWVRRALNLWEQRGRVRTVITDIRYDNEAEAILRAGGVIVRIVRPDHELLSGEAATHISEQGINDDLVTVEVTNSGTVTELKVEALKLYTLLESSEA